MYKNCREELLAVLTEYVKEKGENEFTRAEAIAAMRRAGNKYTSETVSAHVTYRCCANIPRYYKQRKVFTNVCKVASKRKRIKK